MVMPRTVAVMDPSNILLAGVGGIGCAWAQQAHTKCEGSAHLVLIDADEKIFIDWGTAGQVTLQPPVGGRIPFKLWVHTHPRFASYWSITDTTSLSLGAGILESAMVLGQPGPKHSSNRSFVDGENDAMLSKQGPLSQWTDEEPVPWTEWYGLNNINVEVME